MRIVIALVLVLAGPPAAVMFAGLLLAGFYLLACLVSHEVDRWQGRC